MIKLKYVLVLAIVLIGLLMLGIFFLWNNRIVEQKSALNNDISNTNINEPISYSIDSMPKYFNYVSSENKFTFKYPIDWKIFRDGRAVGLIPLEKCEVECSSELLTIFQEESSDSPKIWAEGYDGLGYTEGKAININDYEGFYAVYDRSIFKDIKYTLKYKDLIVHTNFRELDNTNGQKVNDSKYTSDMELIIKSINFLN